jgi:hypothetical protein
MATKTWAERFPHPGDPPARPADEEAARAGGQALKDWWAACHTWNTYVQALRWHQVALAVATLDAKAAGLLAPGGPVALTPAEIIALNVGASFLDGTIWVHNAHELAEVGRIL